MARMVSWGRPSSWVQTFCAYWVRALRGSRAVASRAKRTTRARKREPRAILGAMASYSIEPHRRQESGTGPRCRGVTREPHRRQDRRRYHTDMEKLAVLGVLMALALPLGAQRGGGRGAPPAAENAAPATPAKMEDKTSKTEHTITINGQTLKYTAVAGTLVLRKEDGTATASIFYTAYTKDDVADLSKRPLTFAFNGGPGSSSV